MTRGEPLIIFYPNNAFTVVSVRPQEILDLPLFMVHQIYFL